MIRVVIAEDQKMLLGAFSSLLSFEADIEVVGEAQDGQRAWELIVKETPDVCILDIEMPHMTGLELARKIEEEQIPSKVMIVTTFSRVGYLQKAIDSNVTGYLLKDEPIDLLIESIRKVAAGERVVSHSFHESRESSE